MNKIKLRLITFILWCVNTAIWIFALCYGMYTDVTPIEIRLLHGLCITASAVAAVASWIRYKNEKEKKR